jgi:hypothetical protein
VDTYKSLLLVTYNAKYVCTMYYMVMVNFIIIC